MLARSTHLPHLSATEAYGHALAQELRQGDLLALDGALGAGKTSLVRGLLRGLGGDPELVQSPTYTLLHQYQAATPLVHVDAYRLQNSDDLLALGFEELSAEAIAVIEWAARLDGLEHLASRVWHVRLEHRADGRQAILVQP